MYPQCIRMVKAKNTVVYTVVTLKNCSSNNPMFQKETA